MSVIYYYIFFVLICVGLVLNNIRLTAELTLSTNYKYCVAVHVRDAKRHTGWATDDPPYIKFVKFGYTPHVDHVLPGDSLALERTMFMFKRITTDYKCEYVLKLDDDVDFYKENLKATQLPTTIDYGGFLMKAGGTLFASGGAGYVVRGKLAKQLPTYCNDKMDMEDVGVAACLRKHFKVVPSEIKGFNPDTPEQMINWARRPSFDHISTFDIDTPPITFHYVQTHRTPGGAIPKRLHIIWFGDKAPPSKSIRACKEVNSDWEFFLWTDESLKLHRHDSKHQKHFITDHLCDHVGERDKYLCMSDLFRLEVLYLFGGIYVDADSMCQKPFNELPLDKMDLFAAYENEFTHHHKNLVANGVLGASRYNSDIFKLLFNIHKLQVGEPWSTTGPCLVTQSLFNKDSAICPKNKVGHVGGKSKAVEILSSRYFYPVHFSGFSGPGTKGDAIKNAFTVQKWSSSSPL